MDLQLNDKHVLITGGSKGIGLACARGFLQEGARLTLVSRQASNLEAAKLELCRAIPDTAHRLVLVAADLQEAHQAEQVLAQAEQAYGAVDVLVNSAGAAKRTPPDALDAQAWHDAMDAKFFTYVHMMTPVIKKMGHRGQGVIVNIIGAGGKVANATHLPGGAANAALMLVSAGLASAYGAQGVRVNAVNPGATLTERLQSGLEAEARLQQISADEALLRATAKVPMGRLARPDEVANAVLFLASPCASYVTGAILAMDGCVTPMVV